MKVNQIIGEHKKGFRAKKYTKKTQHTIEPVKPKKPVGPGEEVNETVKVTAVDTGTGNVTYKDDVTGVETTVPKGMAVPTAQGQVQISAQQVAPGEAGAQQAPVIKVGDQVDVIGQTGQTQTMGSMEEDGEEVPAAQPVAPTEPAASAESPFAHFSNEYLQKAVDAMNNGVRLRLLISGPDAEAELKRRGAIKESPIDMTGDPNEQPYDDPQMETIKKLAGL